MLGGIADTVAQTLTATRQRAIRKPGGVGDEDFLAIEIHELDKRNPVNTDLLIPESFRLPPPFDVSRLARFMFYGFMMAPIQHRWFSFISATFPLGKKNPGVQAMKRVALDQLVFAPVGRFQWSGLRCIVANGSTGLAVFFTFMTVAEGGGRRALSRKMKDIYIPSLKANYLVW